jgi:hypothetical protein
MTSEDVERIARAALRELGAGDAPLAVSRVENDRDCWQIHISGPEPHILTIRAGAGTTANFVREQVFNQFANR